MKHKKIIIALILSIIAISVIVIGEHAYRVSSIKREAKVVVNGDSITNSVKKFKCDDNQYVKGDGVHDDTTGIQNAIDSLNTVDGGVLLLPTGTYMVSSALIIPSNKVTLQGSNNSSTIIKAKVIMDKIISCSNKVRISIRDIQINGDNKANIGLYTSNVGMLRADNIVVQKCLDKGIFLDNGTWMFNLDNVYVLNNVNYGMWVGDDCAGSKMNMVVAEENGINLRIGYTRTILFTACTFQRYKVAGNILVQAGWDITFDTCWFEASAVQVNGETYDIKLAPVFEGNTGHNIRILNSSFHGIWGATLTKTKHCIIDGYGDTTLTGNYIDGSQGGYTSGKWYENSNSDTKVVGFSNQIIGGQGYTLAKYAMWQATVGAKGDKQIAFNNIRIADKIVINPQDDIGYSYDGYIYNNINRHSLQYSVDGKLWDLTKEATGSVSPISGTWRVGDICKNDTPISGGYIGWVCIKAGTPGVWKGYGLIAN